jgi:HAD superfamily hydrolase (TIGR01484 family)
MAEADVCFAPCSGRTFYEMPLCIRNNPNIRYYIGADGSAAWKKSDDKITKIVDLSMNREQACQMFDILDKYDYLPSVRSDGYSYISSEQCCDDAFVHHRIEYLYGEFLKYYCIKKDNFSEFIRELGSVEMVCAFFKTDEEMTACKRELEALGEYKVTSSAPTNIEIISIKAGKGNGVLALADRLGIPYEKTVGVGDSKNDLDMLSKVALPLAMKNASDDVKAIAKRTICHYKEHSAKYILENILEL